MRNFNIGKVTFSDEKVVTIAEAGVNHLGDLTKAEKLVAAAKRAGADIIKFQTYKAQNLTTKNAERFWSWDGEEEPDGSQYDSYSKLDSFGIDDYKQLKSICDTYEIEFMSTPFDDGAVDLLVEVGVGGFKVASCDLNNFPLLEKIASQNLPILLSTGGANIDEVVAAVHLIESRTDAPLLIMHCTLTYPTPPEDANLGAIIELRRTFDKHLIGLSDHTLGVEIAAASVLLGVRAIEKHFTHDKTLPLSADHWLSADEKEMSALVQKAALWREVAGTESKVVLESENLARRNARRSVVAARDMSPGDVLGVKDLNFKRPGTGVPPNERDLLIGGELVVPVKMDDQILLHHLKSKND